MLYVITAVHNRRVITEKFIDMLLRQTYKDFQLILIDDGSTDGTADMVQSKMPQAVILQGDGNLWWGGALHKAYLWVKDNAPVLQDDFIMLANDDTDFPEDYIERAISMLSDKFKVLLTGCGISRQSGKQVDGAIRYDLTGKTPAQNISRFYAEGNCASTRSLFFRIRDFLVIGGFHPVLLPHYGSDYEWTIRACRKYGYRVVCDETLRYLADETTTGDNQYHTLTRKKLFSKRSVSNPFYKFSFILMITPARYIPLACFYQIQRYIAKIPVAAKILKR